MSSSLPALVRRYAERVLPAGRGAGQVVRIEQVGEMVLKPGARARRFTAHQDLATDRVSFVWRARFPMLGPISLRVIDSYQEENGLLEVRLGWVGEYRDYRDFGGVVVPTRGEVRWELPSGPFTYWRAAITSFELCD